MINGPAADGYPIVNYEYAIVQDQPVQRAFRPRTSGRSCTGSCTPARIQRHVPGPGGLPAAAGQRGAAVRQPDRQDRQLVLMASPASMLDPEGEAGTRPLPRRVGAAVAAALRGDRTLKWTGRIFALLPALALLFILITLIVEAIPAIKFNGLGFFTKSIWSEGSFYTPTVTTNGVTHPQGAAYGARARDRRDDLDLGDRADHRGAVRLSERRWSSWSGCRPGSRASSACFLELLAGIPSVVDRALGRADLRAVHRPRHRAVHRAGTCPTCRSCGYFRGDTGNGQGLLVSGMILAIMVIPIVAATTRDLIRQVPILPREGAIALGMSDFECAQAGHVALGGQRHRRRGRARPRPCARRDHCGGDDLRPRARQHPRQHLRRR